MVDESVEASKPAASVGSDPVKAPLVRDFWPATRKRAIVITVLMQIIVSLVTMLSLLFVGFDPASIEFPIVAVAVLSASIGLNIILMNILLAPLKDLSNALTHISGEPSDIIPPNASAPARRYDGLGPLLSLIYGLSSQQGSDTASELAGSEQRVAQALKQTAAGLIVMDESGTIGYASRHAPVVTDSDKKHRLNLLFDPAESFEQWLSDCREHQVHSQRTWRRVANGPVGEPDRRIFDILATYEKGSSSPVVLVTFDHTEHYQPEDDQLDFISFAAHELRGPVTVIRGYLDVFREELEEPQSDPRERKMLLERMIVSANRLSGYIGNILNASRYDRQHLKIRLHEYTLAQVYALIADDMRMRAHAQNRLLNVVIPADLPTIAADPSTLSEVLSNLIDNAIKYSSEGGTISVTASADKQYTRVSVTDQGVGMPANVVSNLFHKFYRSHRSREAVAGTGIGLYISKAIVEAHGGVLEVKSTEGKGSTFSVSLPIYATVADKLAASDNNNQSLIRPSGDGWIKNHAKYRG